MSGLYASPWPAEDGGPRRQQEAGTSIAPGAGERLVATARSTLMSTMTILGDPGEVFLLTHSAIRARFGLATTSQVTRIDPVSLRPLARSPRLPGGPMWPGGMALHANGDLYVVYGRWAHRLGRDCTVKASLELPVDAPYNSFVVLACGLIVAKNLSDKVAARLIVIDPATMRAVAEVEAPEASIARLSACGDTVYLVGVRRILRFDWRHGTLVRDPDWAHDYLAGTANSYGWDVVLAGGHAWFVDNGHHRYRTRMLGAGVRSTANRLVRVSLTDAGDHDAVEISGLPGGTITNPPLVDAARGIIVTYDSGNNVLRAIDFINGRLTGRWRRDWIGAASHMLHYPAAGQFVTNDFGSGGEWVVIFDIETGAERGRIRVGGFTQGVVFPSPGWDRDLYWCSMSRVARISVAAAR